MKDKEDAINFLRDLIKRMNAQNNRATATPYFYVVRRERWRLAHDEFYSGTTRKIRVDFEGDPTTFLSKEDFVKWVNESHYGEVPADYEIDKKWEAMPEYTEELYFEDENVFFTEDAYMEHERLNGHNLGRGCRDYYSYVKHAFRNPELVNMFEAIGIVAGEQWIKR